MPAHLQRAHFLDLRLQPVDLGEARVDFLLTSDGQAYCLEANTLPGMTPTSLLPQEAENIGIDYASLCETIVSCSLKRDSQA